MKARRRATDWVEFWQYRLASSTAVFPKAFAIFIALAVCVVLLQPKVRSRLLALWQLRVSATTSMTPHLAALQYNEMLRLLMRRGLRKAPGQTPLEFATSVPDVNLAVPVRELTSLYHAARFGGHTSDPQRTSSLLERIQSLVRSR
jgi:hypothetical protein